jgi:hypothetical protein
MYPGGKMKQLSLFLSALFVASLSFAATANISKTKNDFNNAWKSNKITGVKLDHDINMVYGGEDVSPRHDLVTDSYIA